MKYGRAVAHVARMARHLRQAAGPALVELEVSVDETETPTSPAEHYWVANELNRLEVEWVSLRARFVGRFEKGVDYIGDLAALEKDIAAHAALARHFGPYKLSLHSGSDKFKVYPIAARLAQGLVHLKTAGTSYLEALRTVAAVDPAFFRAIYAFARERYDTDKASYHVSAELERRPSRRTCRRTTSRPSSSSSTPARSCTSPSARSSRRPGRTGSSASRTRSSACCARTPRPTPTTSSATSSSTSGPSCDEPPGGSLAGGAPPSRRKLAHSLAVSGCHSPMALRLTEPLASPWRPDYGACR